MRARHLFWLLLAALGTAPVAQATSVIPPSFPELVAEADAIYRGTVASVIARRVAAPDGGSIIKTFVTVAIERSIKGPPRSDITLEFLGGTLGGESLNVGGMPRFAVGNREFVFVQKNGVQLCPLVALAHGRYRVVHATALDREYVARDNGVPLTDPAQVELPLQALPPALQHSQAAAKSQALSPEAFEARIRTELDRPQQPQQR